MSRSILIPFPVRSALLPVLLTAVLAAAPVEARGDASPGKTTARVVVIGFDGVDPRLVEQWMNAGLLPNLDRLRREGSFAHLGTTTPPQTPVSWTSFATGINPGRHGIFDFLTRDVKTYQPGYAMFDVSDKPIGLGKGNRVAGGLLFGFLVFGLAFLLLGRGGGAGRIVALALGVAALAAGYLAVARYVPVTRPVVTRKTVGTPFWERAAAAGKRCRVIRVPAMFPPEPFEHGEIQAGLGVPDIRGTSGTYLFFTTERRVTSTTNTEKGGVLVDVAFLNGEADVRILGPRNKLFDKGPRDITIPLHIKLNKGATPPSVTLTTSGQTLTLTEGEWSGWVRLTFPFNRFIKARGIARFHLASLEPFGLYLSPINLDPEHPLLPLSAPGGWSKALARRFGLFKTIGWENDTFALDEEILSDQAFLDDVDFTVNAWRPMMDQLLTDDTLDLYVHVWDFTDRVGHMFWRTLDPTHPRADSLALAPFKDIVLKTYQKMDGIVGDVMQKLPENTLLLVCSDHGFNTWHKSVNYNTWLVKNGYMKLKGPTGGKLMTLDDLFGQGQFWPNVDWSGTRAYALGLGDLYINLKGREAQGVVDSTRYDAVRDSLIQGLVAFVDTTNGEHPVRHVYRREDVYHDYDPNLIPDLFIANNARYRVSWQTSLGGIPRDLFELNDKKWSGDHCSLDPEITKGVFLANRRLDVSKVTILDLYPTILEALGVTVPDDLDGTALKPLP